MLAVVLALLATSSFFREIVCAKQCAIFSSFVHVVIIVFYESLVYREKLDHPLINLHLKLCRKPFAITNYG